MKTFKNLLAWIAFGLSLAACTKPAEQAASPFDIEKIKPAIEALHQKFKEASTKADTIAFASLYHSQGTVFPPNFETVSTPGKIVSFLNGFFKAGVTEISLYTSEVWGDPEDVVVSGNYEVKGKDGVTMDKGKYIEIWKQENGEWKLFRDIWNTSMPMQMPAEIQK
jgi:ketosteroid isomerase-like protein